MEQVTIKIWKDTKRDLKILAAIEERSMVDIMAEMVRDYLSKAKKKGAVNVHNER